MIRAKPIGIDTCLLTIVPTVPGPAFPKGGPPHVIGLLVIGISRFLAAKAVGSPCDCLCLRGLGQ